jgi:ATP-binding protein involved in chromosome partitioning
MSFGFAANKSAVMRGPMVSQIVSQLLYQTYWGELDYLVIDMPPGTGDIQITVCQEVKLDGAVIVTTPQRLAFVDVVKGIEMFNSLKVKILGVVENMAYHECPKCMNKDEVFGKGYLRMLIDEFGIKNSVQIPLNGEISKFSDLGSPVVLTLPPQHTVTKAYLQLVNRMIV